MSLITQVSAADSSPTSPIDQVLVRYGVIPQVARYAVSAAQNVCRGSHVIVQTERGQELAEVLDTLPRHMTEGHKPSGDVEREATADDLSIRRQQLHDAGEAFSAWQQRIEGWKLEVTLIDVEYTLDGEQEILYVLNDRGPETTRLALLAAAGGFGIITVQPVAADGIIDSNSPGGGCGSGGCGCQN